MIVSVIIPTHNRADALDKTLAKLSGQVFTGLWEVIVVDNNSKEDIGSIVSKYDLLFPSPIRLIKEAKPGASAARNAGAWAATGNFIIFIDNDILTSSDFIQKHVSNLINYPGAWFVGQVQNLPEQQNTPFGQFRKSLEEVPVPGMREIKTITGQTTSMLRSQFVELGGFDENFHVASGEDQELAIRAMKMGIKIYFDPDIKVLHNDWAGTSIEDYAERQRLYTQTEPFFWKKYGNETPRLKMVKENTPPSFQRDRLRLYLWKNTKKVLSLKSTQKAIYFGCRIFEKVLPSKFILWRLYKLAIAGSIYKGFNEGLKIFEVDYDFLAKNLNNRS